MTMEMHRGSAAAAPSPCALERKPSPVPGIGANFVTQVVKPQCFTNALKVGLADHSRAQPQRLTLGFVSRLRHANPGSVMPAQPWRGPEPMYTTVVTPKLALMPVPGGTGISANLGVTTVVYIGSGPLHGCAGMTEPGFACRRRETKPSVSRCGCAREWSARPTFSAFVKHCGFTTWVTKLAPMARYGRGLALSGAGRGRRGRGRAAALLCRVTLQLPLAASPVAQLGRPAAGGE